MPAHRRLSLALVLVPLLAAGCVTPFDRLDPGDVGEALPVVTGPGGATAHGLDPLLWAGRELAGAGDDAPCGDANCERVPFEVALPDGWWTGRDGGLEVSIRWDYAGVDLDHDFVPKVDFDLLVYDEAGTLLATGEKGWFGSVAVIESAPPGRYEAVVVANRGTAAYEGVVQVEARERDAEARELLPNIVTLPLADLRVAYPNGPVLGILIPPEVGGPAMGALGVRGCSPEEHVESGPRRCLRFSNAVGNAGEGAAEVRLAPGSATFAQRVYASDGSYRDVPAGDADFHPVHGHFHYEGFADVRLHAFDLETRTRGEEVVRGEKLGYCFFDIGLVALGLPGTVPPRYGLDGCLVPSGDRDFVMGMSSGWFDLYAWGLSHQYIDVTDVPDGVYELVSVANADGRLLETDATDNAASVVFRMTGDEIEVLHG